MADHQDRLKALFLGAIDLPPDAQVNFVRDVPEPRLREDLELLLASHHSAGEFLERPCGFEAAVSIVAAEPSMVGCHVGAYRIVRELGEGGMGTVFLAYRDDDYRRHVALKIVRRDLAATTVINRFRGERQILAQLEHPNIARLYDGGTTGDGLPYFVMEHVDGLPIDEYCEANGLSIHERLDLFRTVCSAVAHAHRHLVIHRDLKPANLLVTPERVPKLLDFGIAKLVAADPPGPGAVSATQLRALTPEYAAPEQISGSAVSTATDVYALGVMLYQLLTSRSPYIVASGAWSELERAILEQEPVRPSIAAADARLRGDLDTIVLKAIEKDPARRYGTVEQFSEDIRRYRASLPVLARPDSAAYRARRFVGRHRFGVAAVVLLVASLAAGVAATGSQARVAQRERAKAERRFGDVRKLANTLLFDVHDSIRDLAGSVPARQLLIAKGLEYLDSLAAEAGDDPVLLRELAVAYQRLGELQGRNAAGGSLGHVRDAVVSYRKSLSLTEAVMATMDGTSADSLQLATIQTRLGEAFEALDRKQARTYFEAATATLDPVRARSPQDVKVRGLLGNLYFSLAALAADDRDVPRLLDYRRRTADIYEALWKETPNQKNRYNHALALKTYAAALQFAGDLPAAELKYRQALAIDEESVRAAPDDAAARLQLSFTYASLGGLEEARSNLDGALELHGRALEMREALLVRDGANDQTVASAARGHESVARVMIRKAQGTAALLHLQKALALRRVSLDRRKTPQMLSFVAATHDMIARAHAAQRATALARDHAAQALAIYGDLKTRGAITKLDLEKASFLEQELARWNRGG